MNQLPGGFAGKVGELDDLIEIVVFVAESKSRINVTIDWLTICNKCAIGSLFGWVMMGGRSKIATLVTTLTSSSLSLLAKRLT